VVAIVGACALSGCGAQPHGALHVTSLSLTAADGFPGAPTTELTLAHGATFARVARLVPLPLPPRPAPHVAATSKKHPATVCFPMNLAIGLSNGTTVMYPSCNRPRSLQPILRALCPLLHKRGFCALYHNELGSQ
jgi:hypothetical protein